jgi:hypothetical protein
MTKLLVAMTLALGGLAAPAFAGQTIAISYHQVGICKGYDTVAGPVTARSDEAFAIFKIEAVARGNLLCRAGGGRRNRRGRFDRLAGQGR